MARNSEKAMTALARWRQLQLKQHGKLREEVRPFLASEECVLRKAERWRHEVIREIARKVTQIQNAGLGEFKIRDLNDEINKLLREKGHWEDRIVELGGPDYKKIGPKMLDKEGKEVKQQGNRGYKYFGAAKDLPGVRELFEQQPCSKERAASARNRADLMRSIDAQYFNYMNEDEDILREDEAKCEAEAMKAKLEKERGLCRLSPPKPILTGPSQDEIEKVLLMKRKLELMEKYVDCELSCKQKKCDKT